MDATDRGDVERTLAAVWRIESARIIAVVARIVRDVGLAEEIAQDATVAALEQWRRDGLPDNPAAWLTATAKRRAIDLVRRERTLADKTELIARELSEEDATSSEALEAVVEDTIEDDLLRLIFVSCHPVLSPEARVALTLRLLGGLTTDEIARAYLVPDSTIAQRIVRAKKKLSDAGVPFELPPEQERVERLASVLEVIYLVFNEGYTATSGSDWVRPALCEEAMRLGRILAELVPDEPEVHGLVGLMELQASRIPARTAADGTPILLLEQNRARWDRLLVAHGLAAIERARTAGRPAGPYLLQAELAAVHARARTGDETDWARMVYLYGQLAVVAPSPVVELNRAVAVSMAYGPDAGLAVVDAVADHPALREYHLLPSVRADLLAKLGRDAEARAEFERAASMTRNERERAMLLERAAAL